jgi:hypothetical protein
MQGPILNGWLASKRALAGSRLTAPFAGLDHGHEHPVPKNEGCDVSYIGLGMVKPPGVLCQCCEFVT